MNRTTRPLAWLAVALVLGIGLMAVVGAWAMTTVGGYYGMMGGSWGWGFVMMAVPGVVLVVVLLTALGGLEAPTEAPPAPQGPLTILDERYARGDLTRADYLRARDDLERGRAQS